MARVKSFELYAVDLPFRKPFKHAAAERLTSSSILLKCLTDSGKFGFGECLPRDYVTGESREHSFELLQNRILPRLLNREFDSLQDVMAFLGQCNGKAPKDWIPASLPQTAAWAAVDLALLDAFGCEFNQPVRLGVRSDILPSFRYSAVASAERGWKAVRTLLKFRLYGFQQVKLKIDNATAEQSVRQARRLLGKSCDIRVDANMTWEVPQAIAAMKSLAQYGIQSFEQPIRPDAIQGLSEVVRQTGLGVMVDESLNDSDSLEQLITRRACTAVNVRISKCGGLMASYNRCIRALDAGLVVQVGSQVGETSLLSAAQLILIAGIQKVTYAEGCFGRHLLRADPGRPLVQFGYGGRPPALPPACGLGIRVDENVLRQWSARTEFLR